jgi:hypothetical protein
MGEAMTDFKPKQMSIARGVGANLITMFEASMKQDVLTDAERTELVRAGFILYDTALIAGYLDEVLTDARFYGHLRSSLKFQRAKLKELFCEHTDTFKTFQDKVARNWKDGITKW